jgi:hypothetical protein
MAITQTTYTGNGSTTNYSFTFEYLKQADVKVTLNSVATTAFTFANATTLSFTTAPANGVAIRIFRDTVIDALSATFFPGSAIKAEDLNENFTQNLYVTQESDAEAASATTTANGAVTTANGAVTTANNAVTTANSAETKSDAAVATANTSNTNSTAAVATANTASSNATTAVNTANTATTTANSAVTTANAATATANGAVTTANAATATANTASTNASAAVTTANTANTNSNSAVTSANSAVATANTANTTAASAVTTANGAVTTANTADTNATAAVNTANAASTAVSNAVLFTLIANVAAIPGSPSNDDYVEIGNSTGIESFSPLSGLPSGFVGASGLTVRLRYDSSASSWVFMNYFANDSETRYLTKNLPVVTGDSTNGSGQITLNCENNSHGIKIKGPPHSAGANYTLTLPNDTGTNGQALKTNGSGVLSFDDVSSSIITSTDFAYAPTSNSLTFDDGLNSTPGSTASEFSFFTNANTGNFSFRPTNASIKSNMEALQVGDSVTLDWTLSNGTTASQTTTVTTRTAQPIPSNSYGTVVFYDAPSYHSSSVDTVTLTSSRISNGVEPITNNQVLKYKTATSKWTVDDEVSLSSVLPLAGGTLTGALTLSGNPTAANHAANKTYVDTEVAGIVSSAPATLDTLNELAAALGDDPNFATTVTNSIGTKLPLAGGTLTGDLTISSGRLLVGTTNPVAFGSRQVLAVANGTTGGVLSLYNSTTATANTRISSNPTGSEINDIGIHAASTNGSIIAYTNNDTEALRIDPSGRLLLGTTTEGISDGDNLTIADSGACGITLRSGTSSGGAIYFSDATSGSGEYAGYIEYLHNNNALRLASNGNERLRIDASGNVFIGGTTASSADIALNANGSATFDGTVQTDSWFQSDRTAGSGSVLYGRLNGVANVNITANGNASFAGSITASGNITAYSDINLKENIEVIPNALDKLSAIRGVTFDRTDCDVDRQAGVIAQEVEAVLPEVVTTNEDGIKSVAYGNLVGLLIESIKELKAEVNDLKAQVEV